VKPSIIAVAGRIGAGKSSAADYLEKKHGYKQVALAEPLKRIAMEVYGLEKRHVFGTQEDKAELLPHVSDEWGDARTPRQILEHLGTEGFRAIDPDTWVKLMVRRAKDLISEGWGVVVPDARLPNEFEAVWSMGGEVWLVEKLGGHQERTGHSSDSLFDEYFLKVRNPDAHIVAQAGDMDALYSKVEANLQR
jgi:hypothetical protein